jgi:hypothetical protein
MTTVTLTGSGTVFNPATDNGDNYIFTDASVLSFDIPGMNFIGSATLVNTNPLLSTTNQAEITQNPDDPAPGSAPVDVEIQGGLQISGGFANDVFGTAELDDTMQPGTGLTIDGTSNLNLGGVFRIVSLDEPGTPTADTTVRLTGTINESPLGTNIVDFSQTNLIGGTIVADGENDRIELGGDPSGTPPPDTFSTGPGTDVGTNFILEDGTLAVGSLTAFQGSIGPLPTSSTFNGSAPTAMGFLAEVDIRNAMNVASASFDTSTGLLSFLNASSTPLASWHFSGDASGLVLNMTSSGLLVLTDETSSNHGGNIPITFHA